jgi:hypothetical protein
MKHVYIALLGIVCFTSSERVFELFQTSATDYTCMSDCMDKGYLYQYCLKQCEY